MTSLFFTIFKIMGEVMERMLKVQMVAAMRKQWQKREVRLIAVAIIKQLIMSWKRESSTVLALGIIETVG